MLNIEEIYKELSPPIFRYLYRLTGSSQEAEELTQETFYRMLKSIYRFRQDASLTTWLYKIAFNTYQEWKRKKGIYCFRYGLTYLISEQTEDPDAVRKKETYLIKEALFMLLKCRGYFDFTGHRRIILPTISRNSGKSWLG